MKNQFAYLNICSLDSSDRAIHAGLARFALGTGEIPTITLRVPKSLHGGLRAAFPPLIRNLLPTKQQRKLLEDSTKDDCFLPKLL